MTRVPFTVTWIEQGSILVGSIPQVREDIEQLCFQGVYTILSLTRRNLLTYPAVDNALIDNGIACYQFPIPDGGLADDKAMFEAISALNKHSSYGCAYLHCRGGIGRTGTVLLGYYVLARGMSLSDAKERVKVRRNYEGNASAIDQGTPQREWIDRLEQRRDEYQAFENQLWDVK